MLNYLESEYFTVEDAGENERQKQTITQTYSVKKS